MTARKMSTYHTDDEKGYAEVWLDLKDEFFYIEFFDEGGSKFFSEDYPGKKRQWVENRAEDWVMGEWKIG